MPDFFSHMFLGQAALPGMPGIMQESASQQPALFNLGCQGPDLYFYYKLMNPQKRCRAVAFANLCHDRKTRDLLAYGAAFLLTHREDREFVAYWTGFLCHYALDRSAHPFINAHTSGFRAHKKLEMHLDAYMLHRKWESAPYRVRIPRLIELPNGLPESVTAFWTGLAREVYGYELDPAVIGDSYKGMRTITGLYYSPHRAFRPIKGFLGIHSDLDHRALSIGFHPFESGTPAGRNRVTPVLKAALCRGLRHGGAIMQTVRRSPRRDKLPGGNEKNTAGDQFFGETPRRNLR